MGIYYDGTGRPVNALWPEDYCLCGSGLRFFECCGKQKDSYYLPYPPEQFDRLLFNEVFFLNEPEEPEEDQEFTLESITEAIPLDAIITQLEEEDYLNSPQEAFLGLTPNIIRYMILNSFSENSKILELNTSITEKEMKHIPILNNTWYFLEQLSRLTELKATKKGNLPRSFVRDLFENAYQLEDRYTSTPYREEDNFDIYHNRILLTRTGLIKKRKNRFSLTNHGKKILEERDFSRLYSILFEHFIEKYNWSFGDEEEDLPLLQLSLIFNLYILKKQAKAYISGKDLGRYYVQAFSNILEQFNIDTGLSIPQILFCFECRFLYRFCKPFGLLEMNDSMSNDQFFYKTTPFFNSIFSWGLE